MSVNVWLTGSMVEVIGSGNWPSEHPEAWAEIKRSSGRRYGKGRAYSCSFSIMDAIDLAAYLEGVADLVGSVTAAERDGGREHIVAREAVARLTAAIKGARS